MKISLETIAETIETIQKFEGFRNEAYQDGGGVWTIGWGRTGKSVISGSKTTAVRELDWLRARAESDLIKIGNALTAIPETMLETNFAPKSWAALASLAYNIGIPAFEKSTLCKLLRGELTPTQTAIEKAWLSWNKDNGKIVRGLCNRRMAEWNMFMTGVSERKAGLESSKLPTRPITSEIKSNAEANPAVAASAANQTEIGIAQPEPAKDPKVGLISGVFKKFAGLF